MTGYVIPLIFLTVLIVSTAKKNDAYATFIQGSKSALNLMAEVFPFLLAVMMAVEVFKVSGLSSALANFLSPVMNLLGLPKQLTELMLIRPLSGAGAMAVLDDIYLTYGTDTYIGLCASVIYGSSETVFYVSSIYFSKSQVKNLRYALPVALLSTLVGCVVGCWCLRAF